MNAFYIYFSAENTLVQKKVFFEKIFLQVPGDELERRLASSDMVLSDVRRLNVFLSLEEGVAEFIDCDLLVVGVSCWLCGESLVTVWDRVGISDSWW